MVLFPYLRTANLAISDVGSWRGQKLLGLGQKQSVPHTAFIGVRMGDTERLSSDPMCISANHSKPYRHITHFVDA